MATQTTKYKSYPVYKPSGVEWLGEIPTHWEVRRLWSTVLSCQNGVWGTEPNGSNEIACVRVADFDRVRFRANIDRPTLRSVETDVFNTRKLLPGDLLLEVSGGGEKQPVGAIVLYDNKRPAVCSNFIARLRPSEGFESRFLTYLHSALYSLRVNVRSIKQSIGIQNLDKASYLSEAAGFPRPPRTARHRRLPRPGDREDRRPRRKEGEADRAAPREAHGPCQPGRHQGPRTRRADEDSGVEWLGEIPAHWEVKRLKHLGELQAGAGFT